MSMRLKIAPRFHLETAQQGRWKTVGALAGLTVEIKGFASKQLGTKLRNPNDGAWRKQMAVVVGTRSDVIKMAPVVRELGNRASVAWAVDIGACCLP